MMGGKINGAFTVLMYENGEANANIIANDKSMISLKLKAVTKFPLDGRIDYTVNPSKPTAFAINFRVPEWSENFTATVGDKQWHGKKSELLNINRKWNPGDHIAITFNMPLQVLPGGLSYPNSIAFKRGPQIMAVDKLLNPAIGSLKEVNALNDEILTDAKATLPQDWDWKQAYDIQVNVNDKPQKVVLVPFSEAGQKASEIEVWVKRNRD